MERSDEREDDELVASARQGRAEAFDVLLRRHEGRVLRVLRLLGVPRQDREDAAQEVFLRVFRHLGSFRPGGSFAGWLYRITVNTAHDQSRRLGRRWADEVGWVEGTEVVDPKPSPGRRLQDLESRRRLEGALESLSERERAVFVLRELEGLETADVARALGITSITVRRHLGRARRHLQNALGLEKKPQDR